MTTNWMTVLNAVVLLGAAVSAVLTVMASRMMDSVIALAAVGSFIAVEFMILNAPDVAISEASVGVALGTVLYVVALRRVMKKGGDK